MKKRMISLVILTTTLITFACSLPATESTPEYPATAAAKTASAQLTQAARDQEADNQPAPTIINSNTSPTQESSSQESITKGTPGIINCDLLNISKFNAIMGFDYSFVDGATDYGCVYTDKQSRSYLTILLDIQGEKQMSQNAVENKFNHFLETANNEDGIVIANTNWKSYPKGYSLGIITYYETETNNARGMTLYGSFSNGYVLHILSNDISSTNNLDQSLNNMAKLAEEVARQINKQWR